MATQKPISTISYNSESFLREKLDVWLKGHIIQAYQYICHKGEDGDKDHIHLRIEPNKKIDQMDLSEALREYVHGQEKPLGCRPWRPSKEEDWWLYAVHDKTYLELKYGGGDKGEKLPYDWHDVKVPEFYDAEVAFVRAKSSLEHTAPNIAKKLQDGSNALTLVSEGNNPFTVRTILQMLKYTDYERLQLDYMALRDKFFGLYTAISELGYEIEETDGVFNLRKKECCDE